jgi:hypothetical protein
MQAFFPESAQNYAIARGVQLLGPIDKRDNKMNGVSDKDMLDFCILIVMTEHLILAVRFFLQDYIADIPPFVAKQIPGIVAGIEIMNHLTRDVKIEA